MENNRFRSVIVKSLVTLVLIVGVSWLWVHNRQHRTVFYKDYAFQAEEQHKFRHFPKALYDIGLKFWFDNDTAAAAPFFREAVMQDVLFVDAWLKLAQTEIVLGNPDKARTILQFSDELTRDIFRWKWEQTLLANELEMEDLLLGDINFTVKHGIKVQDAFQLLDGYLDKNVTRAIQVLDMDNLIPCLEWMMRWGRADDAKIVWQEITASGIQNEEVRLKYIHFLVSQKQVKQAADIRRQRVENADGITNAGFENEITHQGFDWRYTANQKGKWTIRRTLSGASSGEHCLKIRFEGKENISFGHLYQIVPVDPMTPYRLTYHWRSRDLTTDQGPFVGIYGYDSKGFSVKGAMMLGTHGWQKQVIEFTAPKDCHAVVVRLHRRPSHRFDSKIAGRLWLDDFRLEKDPAITKDEI
ncbi:MAG: tetratricopeptide repeat protein [Deltaproteobacteria bacterium]|nr:tetratricopeptide repeat protein [Deltaproteobacteria bacterium]